MAGTAFVTGGTGFVGGAVLRRLVAEGREVRALTRSDRGVRAIEELGAIPVRGDVLDGEVLSQALEGSGTVFHVAGVNSMCLRDTAPMFRANVLGSENIIRAAAAAGVRRVVYTSSAATIGEARGTIARESSPHRGWFLSSYERSKHLAEIRVFAEAEAVGLDVLCVNPSSVQGPGRVEGTAKLLLAAVNGRLPGMVDATISLVDVADCAEGHLLAEDRGVPGQRYLLSGATLSTRDAIALLESMADVRLRVRWLPRGAAVMAASLVEGLARVSRRRAPICREMVRTLLHGHAYDGSRASRELGLRYTPIEDTLRRTLTWYAERGLIRRRLPGLAESGTPGR